MEGVIGTGTTGSRRIMVVADTGRESAGALQYALSHAVVENDELILLHVENCSSWRNTFSFLRRSSTPALTSTSSSSSTSSTESVSGDRDLEFLEVMKHICEAAQPRVKVHIERVDMEGKDKASAILLQCKVLSIDVLVIGQRRSLSNAILGLKGSSRGTRGMDTAEYLIENSKCTCVGVQKKGQTGGYVLNTKTHKNFWLLA